MDEAARARIRELHDHAEVLSDGRESVGRPDGEPPSLPVGGVDRGDDEGHGPPSDMGGDPAIVRECASLDQSDTDNAKRLIAHFGQGLAVVARDGFAGGDWIGWEGRFWDHDAGAALATRLAQKVGGRIAAEAAHLALSPEEARVVGAAEAFADGESSEMAKAARAAAKAVRAELAKRRTARWRFAVSSKNAARIESMMKMAAPLKRVPSASFNGDPLKFAAQNATVSFVVEDDPDCPDPDVRRKTARAVARAGHERGDFLTGLVASPYDPEATRPKWDAFLERFLTDPEVRRTVKAYSGMGLIGILAQKVCFHYGLGANGKSVFLAVLSGVIGPSLGVSLPKETIMGTGERGAGQASPDLVRLFGRRFVRIDEVKAGESLKEDLIKRLTGGDTLVVRDLYRGYLEFDNVATPHMIGNGDPKIEGTDDGIWRRMLKIHWSVTIPEPEQRPFGEVVGELMAERAGILNWLVEGACDFLANGLFIAEACAAATREMREDLDPIGRFVAACVEPMPTARVQARTLYEAYKSWAMANAVPVSLETKFGREMKKRFPRDDRGQTRAYLDIALHDVPARPDIAEDRGGAFHD